MSILSKTPRKSNLIETFSRLSAAPVALPAVGASLPGAGSYVNERIDAGRLNKNGKGWQVFA